MIALDARKDALTAVGRMTITYLSVTDAEIQQPIQRSLYTMVMKIIAKIVGVKGCMKWE